MERPVSETVQEVLKDRSEMFTSSNSGDSKDDESDGGPNESRNHDGLSAEVLHAEAHGIEVGDGDGNGREDEGHLDEFTKPIDTGSVTDEGLVHETTCSGAIKGIFPGWIAGDAGHKSSTEPHDEDLSGDEGDISPGEESSEGNIFLHIDRVVGGEGKSGDGITETSGHEGHPICHLSLTASHGKILYR
jgi:hypothetical protein